MSMRLPRITAELVHALKRAGWYEIRQTGSHLHLGHPERPGTVVTVPMHAGRTLPVGTLRAIINQAGLSADELHALLWEVKTMRKYTVILEFDQEAGLYSAVVPALPGCTSAGAMVEEALANTREAIQGHIAALEALGAPVPEEGDGAIVIVATIAA
jgi:predicted RNA binding protein YcfA (HicA-like mRNA interferase family)/predicted RNase H-like HicB family nuclease